jgi:hypothetical protein
MNEKEFHAAAERITNTFRDGGFDAAVEERDLINRELAAENLFVDIRGPAGGNTLSFFLHSLTTNEELFRITTTGRNRLQK